MSYLCEECGELFSTVWTLERHVKRTHKLTFKCDLCKFETEDKQASIIHRKQHAQEYFQCKQCNKTLNCKRSLLRHVREQHEVQRFSCPHCNYHTNRKYQLNEHKKTHKVKQPTPKPKQSNTLHNVEQQNVSQTTSPSEPSNHDDEFVRSAFNGKMQERAWFIRGSTDPLGAVKEYKNRIRDALFLSLKKSPQKFYIAVKVRFFKKDKDGHKSEDSTFFHGAMHTVLRKEDFEEAYQTSLQKIWKSFDIYIRNGSGWILERVEKIFLNTYNYHPTGISSYIPTPKAIATKKAVVNVQNEHNKKCFEYSVLAALYHDDIKHNVQRPSQYDKYLGKVLKGCKEPMTIDDIPHFETLNGISIAVYRIKHDGETVFPLYMTKRRKQDPINLLLIEGDEHSHFAWIKDFNKLCRHPNEKHAKVFCPYCCYGFRKNRNGKNNLAEHKIHCRPHGAQRTKFLPKGENFVQFNDFEKMQELPFCIYADFETINKKVEGTNSAIDYDENLEPVNSGTELKTNHQVSGFTFHTVSPHFPQHTVTYRNSDAGEVFLEKIHEEKQRILQQWADSGSKEMVMTSKDEYNFKRASHCYICKKDFVENPENLSQAKVRDHDHFSGKYRGAAHSKCNIAMRTVKKIPVFFHNLAGYDAHIIFNNLNKVPMEEPSVINIDKI